ncbi:hypothetical protein ACFVXC_31825 [Streptomyces sp. NPDC058257]|uniref:hypothetical protein n=1 Tax=Streptomyces sp. NPDC058257 TaxID=3346409 RepID=UPI0036E0E903
MIIGREGAATAWGRWLLAGLLVTVGCWSAAGSSAADGPGSHGLALEVTVNSRPGLGALHPGIRTGAVVVKSYRLVNRGGADLYEVRVRDPGMPGAVIRCPGGRDRVPMLAGLRSVRCTATGAARPGDWIGEVRAVGQQPYLRAGALQAAMRSLPAGGVRATARSGYTGVGAALTLTETARVTGPRQAEVRYVLANRGNRPVHGVRITDPVLAPARIACTGGRPVVAHLAAGAHAACTAVVRRPPGTYVSGGRADGSDLLRTLGPRGEAVIPPRLTARALARFTLRARAPTTPLAPRPRTPVVNPGQRPRAGTPASVPRLASQLPAVPLPPGIAAPGAAPPGGGAPGVGPPGVAPPGPAAPEEAAPGVAPPPPPAVPDGAGQAPAAVSPAVPPAAVLPPAVPPAAVPKEAEPRHPLLSRFVRTDHTPTGMGMVAALLLVLLPAAIAAAVFGSRRL